MVNYTCKSCIKAESNAPDIMYDIHHFCECIDNSCSECRKEIEKSKKKQKQQEEQKQQKQQKKFTSFLKKLFK